MVSINSNFNNRFVGEIATESFSPIKPFHNFKEKINNFFNFFDEISFKSNQKKNSVSNISFIDSSENKPINSNTKVLIIGDSQTYGNYGTKLDELVRKTGAKTITHASWGSGPSCWFNGWETVNLWSKGLDGKETRTHNVATPNIEEILKKEKPDVVIVTMGGNMIANATQESVTTSVDKIGSAITSSGAKLYWAGPPKYDPAKRTPEQLETFYGFLAKAVSTHGTFIDSRKFIDEYHGRDGLHYSGKEGNKQTNKWAEGVFNEIQKKK